MLVGRWSDDSETSAADQAAAPPPAMSLYESNLGVVTAELADLRAVELDRLRDAERPQAQTRAIEALALAYGDAARDLSLAQPPAELSRAHSRSVVCLRSTDGVYRQLGSAAAAGERASYRRARAAVARVERACARQLAATLNAAQDQS